MKLVADDRHDNDDHMTVEEIVERIRWLDETLTYLHRELATAANPDDPCSPPILRLH